MAMMDINDSNLQAKLFGLVWRSAVTWRSVYN